MNIPATCILCGAKTYTNQGRLVSHSAPGSWPQCPMERELNIWESLPLAMINAVDGPKRE